MSVTDGGFDCTRVFPGAGAGYGLVGRLCGQFAACSVLRMGRIYSEKKIYIIYILTFDLARRPYVRFLGHGILFLSKRTIIWSPNSASVLEQLTIAAEMEMIARGRGIRSPSFRPTATA